MKTTNMKTKPLLAGRSMLRLAASSLLVFAVACGAEDNQGSDEAGNGEEKDAAIPDSGTPKPDASADSGTIDSGAAGCTTRVDGVPIHASAADLPFVIPIDQGFALASLRGGEVWVTLIDDQAAVLSDTQVSEAAGGAHLPSIHAQEDAFSVLWAEGNKVFSRRLQAGGTPTGEPVLIADTGSDDPRPLGSGAEGVVAAAWMHGEASTAAILESGKAQDVTTIPGWFPAVAVAGQRIGIAWSEGGERGTLNVGTFDDPGERVAVEGTEALIMDLAASEGAYYAAWEDVGGAKERIGLARVDLAQETEQHAFVTDPDKSANWPAVAVQGERVALAYYQFREGDPSVYLEYFHASNLSSYGYGLEIAQGAKYPSVAWADGEVVVAYSKVDGPVEVSVVRCN